MLRRGPSRLISPHPPRILRRGQDLFLFSLRLTLAVFLCCGLSGMFPATASSQVSSSPSTALNKDSLDCPQEQILSTYSPPFDLEAETLAQGRLQRRLKNLESAVLEASPSSLQRAQRLGERLLQRLVEASDGGASQRPAAATAAAWLALARGAGQPAPAQEHGDHEGHHDHGGHHGHGESDLSQEAHGEAGTFHHSEGGIPGLADVQPRGSEESEAGALDAISETPNPTSRWLWQAAWALDSDAAAAVVQRVREVAEARALPAALTQRALQDPATAFDSAVPAGATLDGAHPGVRPPAPAYTPWESEWGPSPESAFLQGVPLHRRLKHRPFSLEQVPLDLLVGADGQLAEVTLLSEPGRCPALPTPRSLLAAFEAVQGWTFRPAQRDGQPTAGRLQLRYAATPLALASVAGRDGDWIPLHGALLEERWEEAVSLATQQIETQRGCAVRNTETCQIWRAYALRALARAAAGELEGARQDWGRARVFAPSPRVDDIDLHSYGPEAEALAALRDELRTDWKTISSEPDSLGLVPLQAPRWRAYPESLVVEPVRIRALIDAAGKAYAPQVLAARTPAQADAALTELDGWRFPPSPLGGPRVATLDLEPLSPEELAAIDPTYRIPETGEPGGPAEDPIPFARLFQFDAVQHPAHETLLRGGRAPTMALSDHSAGSLALQALASAGAAIEAQQAGEAEAELGLRFARCLWRSAQRLYPALVNADLSAYGAGGALLEEVWIDLPARWRQADGPAYGYWLPGDDAPRRQRWTPPQLGERAREAGLQGEVEVLTFLSHDGTVLSTRVLKGIALDGTLASVRTLCRSDYRPGSRNGEELPLELVEVVRLGAAEDEAP
ncbi:MAG: hypothetical protein AAGD01_14130 [Acidobacteriota bacterium]